MALPQQLKTARSTNATPVSSVDNVIGEVEQAVADILGVPVNTDILEPVVGRAKYAQILDSAAIANTAVETAFNKAFTIPANNLGVGNIIKVRAFGKFTAVSGSLDFRIRIGGVNVAAGGVGSAPIVTNLPWFFETEGIIRSIGAGGSYEIGRQGGYIYPTNPISSILGTTGIALDTTASKIIDVTAIWSIANPSNSITMRGLVVEIIPAASTS